MKPQSYYIQLFLGFSIGTFLYSMLFGDFYPVVKSLFSKDTNTSFLFQKTAAQVSWAHSIIKPLFIGSFIALIRFVSDKGKANI